MKKKNFKEQSENLNSTQVSQNRPIQDPMIELLRKLTESSTSQTKKSNLDGFTPNILIENLIHLP